MTIEDFLRSDDYRLFLDETLRQQACQAVDDFLEHHQVVAKSQLYSIPSIIQAAGLNGLTDLVTHQKDKNSKSENKAFWLFIAGLLGLQGDQSPAYSLRTTVEAELNKRGIFQELIGDDTSRQRSAKKARTALLNQVMEATLGVYFEHFNCHYFLRTN